MINEMIQVFTGPNDFARKHAIDTLVQAFVAQHGDISLERIDASEIEFGRLLERVATVPFFAERKMIIITQVTTNRELSEGIEQLIDSVSEQVDVLIDEQKFDKRLSLYKTLKKRTELTEFNELDERQLADWLVKEAKDQGGELNKNDALYIVQRAGTNQMGLYNELGKLLSYDLVINRRTIELLVEPLPSSTTFQLLDAAFSGDKKRANELYQDQRLQQVEPQAIMGLIAWQVHVIALVGTHSHDTADTVAKQTKLNPFVVRKTQQLIRHKSQADIRQLVERTVTLDARLKSEMIDADDAVQHYLLTI